MGANSQRRFIPNLYSTCSFIARNASHLFPTIDATYSRSETNSNRNSTRKKTDDTLKSEHFSPSVTRFDTRSKDRITIFQSFANIFANTLENNSVRAIEVRESHWQVARRGDIRFDAFRWRGASWWGRREKGKRRKVVSRFNSCRLLHIHKFCTECQPPVVMLRPRGRPGRLLAYFDDISASAVSPPLPLLLLLSLLRFSVSRAFALSALITTRFVPLSTARPRLYRSKRNCFETLDVDDANSSFQPCFLSIETALIRRGFEWHIKKKLTFLTYHLISRN